MVEVGISPVPLHCTRHDDGTFTLHKVRLGIGFHWDQHRDFRYTGELVERDGWLINRLPLEDYIASVIASEMAPTASLELLKAHAVIARSWVMKRMALRDAHTLFDVCSDDCCQRYQGIPTIGRERATEAAQATRGEVLTYHGELCDTRYSKCCGGTTEQAEYCWDNLRAPYLKAVSDTRPDGSAYCDTRDTLILKQILKDYDQRTTDFFEWEQAYTREELSAILEEKLGAGLGLVTALEPLERGCSGRISRLRIVGTEGEITIGKELAIRKALSRTCLYSSNFEISIQPQSPEIQLKGRGWGHGVGLCQIGAAVMAHEGHDYRSILQHYYTNVTIEQR